METQENLKPLPIGKSFFDKVIEEGCYYVDKTLFIKELLEKQSEVTLCTRPRRFGKTLNQTMLKCFFENTAEVGGKDTRSLFNGLKIESAGEKYMENQGKYPVIYLSFKDAKMSNFEGSYYNLMYEIAGEFSRHYYILNSISQKADKEMFEKLTSRKGTRDDYAQSLRFLTKYLEKYHNEKVIIIIDEYDVPLENSWSLSFYDEMVNFIRPLLSSAFKDNPHLKLAVITGCLRVSKESIFTGLNNLDIISILSEHYDEFFGFTQEEIDKMLAYYKLENNVEILKKWYNGYLFGNKEVYNPWSIVNCVRDWIYSDNYCPRPYWVNTSSNDIVRKLISMADNNARAELETLIAGETIEKIIHEDITYDEIDKNIDNLWNFMLFTGYLKIVGSRIEGIKKVLYLSVPNLELQYLYETKIQEWFKETIKEKNLDILFDAVINGNVEVFQNELAKLLTISISFMDNAENFYHGFMVGILSRINGYIVKSNRESGNGRSDIVVYSANGINNMAIIIEIKTAKKFNEMPAECDKALKQIEENNYAAYWEEEGYPDILKYGIAFYKKRCEIKKHF